MKDIKYINKDFNDLKETLVKFSKSYFPNTYNDFSPSSIGMLFMEMSAYVGDVLSFYMDNQVQEIFINYARQKENLYNLSYFLGYTPKVTTAASVDIDFYQQLPAIASGSATIPDFNYCLKIPKNTQISSNTNNNIKFLLQEDVNFNYSSSLDTTEISVYQTSANVPTFYLLKKTKKAISATINTVTYQLDEPVKFRTIELSDSNIIGILDITDSDGNIWYEVSSLAQDFKYNNISNNINNENIEILRLEDAPRRFTTRFINETTLYIQFGSGIEVENDEEIVPNLDNVGLGLPYGMSKMTTAFSPLNFIFTKSYGLAPSNTTLTIRYLTGGGVNSNVGQNTLSLIDSTNIKFTQINLNDTLAQTIFDSVACNNVTAADGGSDGDSVEEIRANALGNFQSQMRNVTLHDYAVRSLTMSPSLGAVSKVYTEKEKAQEGIDSSINLYILSFDESKKLIRASTILKNNLKSYLSQYKMINDFIKIKDAYIINIGIDFDIITLPNFNNNEVILKCINALIDYFNIDRWQINQPIILRDIYILLDKIEGVQTVKNINIIPKIGNNYYSEFEYDLVGAKIDNIIYPSIDPMIFEIKNPDVDINGRVVNI
jgi:transposase-like protein